MRLAPPPTPLEIDEAPELAILAALDHTLELALRALISTHPQLGDSDCPSWARQASLTRLAAERLLAVSVHLTHALEAYRRAVARSPRRRPHPELEPEPEPESKPRPGSESPF